MTATTEPSERAVEAAARAMARAAYVPWTAEHGHSQRERWLSAAKQILERSYATDETIAALRRDAERYRWLRERSGYVQNKSFVIDGVLEEYLDELIDAALRQAETEGGS